MMGGYFLGLVGGVVGLVLFGLLVRLIWRNEANSKELTSMKWAIDALRKNISSLEVEHDQLTWETRRQLFREIEETGNAVAISLKQLVLSTELYAVMQSLYDNAVADGRLPQRYEKSELDMEPASAAYTHELLTMRVLQLDGSTQVRFGHVLHAGDDVVWRPASAKEKRFASWLAARISEMDHKAIRAMFDDAVLKRMIKLWYYRNMNLDSRENTTRFFRASTALLMRHFSEYEVVEKE